MAHSRGFRPAVSRAPRRQTSWDIGPGGVTQQTLSGIGSVIVGTGATAVTDGLTVIRTRGVLTLRLVTPTTDGFIGAFGIGTCTLAAFTIGVTAVPTPITEQNWDGWLYWEAFALLGESTADPVASLRSVVDSKAMRKLPEDTVLYAAVQAGTEIGTGTMEIQFDSRVLLKI